MTNNTQPPSREITIRRGKQKTVLIICYLIAVEMSLLILKIISNQAVGIVDAIRLSLAVGASIFTYQGNLWAKSFLAFALGVGALISAYTLILVIQNPSSTLFAFIVALSTMLFSGLSSYQLIFSSEIDEFLRSQRERT